MKIQYRILKITETGYYYNFEYPYEELDPKTIRFYLSHELIPYPEEDCLTIKLEVNVTDGEGITQLASNSIAVFFHLSPLSKVVSYNSDGFLTTHNADMVNNLLQAVVGTLRGVLMKNLKGTPLEACPLPLISESYFSPTQ